jgi:cell division FtsZ-interacting protein ZapD
MQLRIALTAVIALSFSVSVQAQSCLDMDQLQREWDIEDDFNTHLDQLENIADVFEKCQIYEELKDNLQKQIQMRQRCRESPLAEQYQLRRLNGVIGRDCR